jgi:hypothetical protein
MEDLRHHAPLFQPCRLTTLTHLQIVPGLSRTHISFIFYYCMNSQFRKMANDIPDYFRDLENEGLLDSIRNFDDPKNLQHFSNAVSSHRSRNFFIDFGDREAWSGFDVEPASFISLLKARVSPLRNKSRSPADDDI